MSFAHLLRLTAEGRSPEEIARTLYQARRDLGITYKDMTPWPLRGYIYETNLGRYRDPLGPTWDDLFLKYQGDFDAISEAATRPNPDIDQLLGGFRDWLRLQPAEFILQAARDFLTGR